MKSLPLSLTLMLGGLISACGGGGGSGGSVGTAPLPTAELTQANQVVVAQEAASTAFMPLLAAQTLTGAQVTDEAVVFSLARDQLQKLPSYMALAKSNSRLIGVIPNETVSCDVSGSMTVSASDPDNDGVVSAGDRVTVTSNNCVMAQGALAGTLNFEFSSLTGALNSNNYNASVTLEFDQFSITSAALSATVNGSLTMSIAMTGPNSSSESMSTPTLSMTGTYAGQVRTRSLSNYTATATTSPDATYGSLTQYDISGVVTSSALSSNAIAFATSTVLVRRNLDFYPYTGVISVTGANKSSIRMTALSASQVKQELDADGDGTYEANITVAWNSLI